VRTTGVTRAKVPEDFSPEFQVALPYRGLFVWHVGCDDIVGDANQVLFVTGGESYRLSEPLPGGCGELVITPEPGILTEIADVAVPDLPRHSLFRRRSRRADPRLQSLRAHFLYWATGVADVDDLAAEEMVLTLLRSALVDDAPRNDPPDASRRLIRRTKEFLAAEFPYPIRLRDVGRAVGASPAYLTDLFRHVEGVPLHRYLVQLRLAHALVELPHTADLTRLALEIGFSSHSHFSAAFRRTFGCTPSQFRQRARNLQLPRPL
jgi:AraC-like DNA-binding protein